MTISGLCLPAHPLSLPLAVVQQDPNRQRWIVHIQALRLLAVVSLLFGELPVHG